MSDLLGIDVNEPFAGLLASHMEAAAITGLAELAERLPSSEDDREYLKRWIDGPTRP